MKYDKNGNITHLTRGGHLKEMPNWDKDDDFGTMDQLDYQYFDGGNRLRSVTDGILKNDTSGKGEFVDGNKDGDDYVYDPNGNMTQDLNKGIKGTTPTEKGIEYNHLNLPTKVSIDVGGANKGTISYIYDATGVKLRKNVLKQGETTPTATDYAGNYIYENNVLKQFGQSEGYVQHDGNGIYSYVYNFKDHLGNVRLSYSDIDKDGSVDQSEILHERNYYPFGMLHKGYNGNIQGSVSNFMEYQGQELDKSLNIDWHHFKYRTYDASIGRFLQIDPLAPTYVYNSTYAFAENNVTSGTDLEGLELSFQFDGSRATGVFGPTQNTFTLQEIQSIVSKKKSEEEAFLNRINTGPASSTAGGSMKENNTINSLRHLPQSGIQEAEGIIDGGKLAAEEHFGGLILKGIFRGVRYLRGLKNAGSVSLEKGASLSTEERPIASLLASEGKTVKVLAESTVNKVRTADFLVDGVRTELKTISNLTGKDLSNSLKKRILEGTGQSRNIILDVTGSKNLSLDVIGQALNRAFNSSGKLNSVRVIGKDFDIFVNRGN